MRRRSVPLCVGLCVRLAAAALRGSAEDESAKVAAVAAAAARSADELLREKPTLITLAPLEYIVTPMPLENYKQLEPLPTPEFSLETFRLPPVQPSRSPLTGLVPKAATADILNLTLDTPSPPPINSELEVPAEILNLPLGVLGNANASDGNELGCCFQIAFRSWEQPCCLKSRMTSKADCETIAKYIVGGVGAWSRTCPFTPEDALALMEGELKKKHSLAPQIDARVGCCYSIGFGAFMKPCCLDTKSTSAGECLTEAPHVLGGSRGWADSCPKTSDEAAKLLGLELSNPGVGTDGLALRKSVNESVPINATNEMFLCMAPDDAGGACAMCCNETQEGCLYKSWTGVDESMAKPWYNTQGIERGTCREMESKPLRSHNMTQKCGPPCAKCDSRSRDELLSMVPPDHCDCAVMGTQLDACFQVSGNGGDASCSCYCSRLFAGLQKCPDLRNVTLKRPMGDSGGTGMQPDGALGGGHNCFTKEKWSDSKREWCCKYKHLGCAPFEGAQNATSIETKAVAAVPLLASCGLPRDPLGAWRPMGSNPNSRELVCANGYTSFGGLTSAMCPTESIDFSVLARCVPAQSPAAVNWLQELRSAAFMGIIVYALITIAVVAACWRK